MAESNSSGIIIDGTSARWEINADGPILGSYKGQFIFRCFLDPIQEITADRDYRDILGPYGAPKPHIEHLAWCLAQLKQRVIKAPPFWYNEQMNGNIPDQEIVALVMDAAIEAELLYKEGLKKRKLDALERAKAAVEKMMKNSSADEFDEESDAQED